MSLGHGGSMGPVSEQVIAGYYQVIIFFRVSFNLVATWRGRLTSVSAPWLLGNPPHHQGSGAPLFFLKRENQLLRDSIFRDIFPATSFSYRLMIFLIFFCNNGYFELILNPLDAALRVLDANATDPTSSTTCHASTWAAS